MPSGVPGHVERLVTLSAQEMSEWGIIGSRLTVEEVEQLIDGLPSLGLRHGESPVYDPVAARALAKDRITALCTREGHDASLTAITRMPDGSLTLCSQCSRRGWAHT